MMDWCLKSGGGGAAVAADECMVPIQKGRRILPDRLPSPDSWPEWGRVAHHEMEEDSYYDKYQSSCPTNHQLGLAGSAQTDDIFFSYLLDDFSGMENIDRSYCLSPKSQCDGMVFNSNPLKGMTSDSQNTSSDFPSLRPTYLSTIDIDDSTASMFVPRNLQKNDFPPVQATRMDFSVNSESSSMSRYTDEEPSLEETVLQGLQSVTKQLTEKTRLSLRDALYRLARSSEQRPMRQNQDGDLCVENNPLWNSDMETRCGTKKATETETNIIDRAIANLMFNKTELNYEDLTGAASSSSKDEIEQSPSEYQSYTSQAQQQQLQHSNVLDDADFGQMYASAMEMESLSCDFSGNGV
ncbi:protein LNK3 isoform X2 [Humulus lupulus]|uniref:protein LNK3 isoform X2 n=1 Tax=Humulus lupulus TaxID=3486 RepID=UPI002B413B91|nr:protein LNK3 isoform X2 [Humulus lupulus]